MPNLIRNLIIVVAALAVSVWAIIPPEEKLRRGKDLAGGVSLVYPVEIEARENAGDTLSRMIEVLKKRVNPTGALDISMVAQGENRIEIAMPLPSDRVRELKRTLDESLAALKRDALDPGALERAVRLSGPERDGAIVALSSGSADRERAIRAAADASDAARSARNAFEEARKSGADAAVIDPLVEAAASAEIAYESARNAALSAAVNPDEVRTALQLPADTKTVLDREKNEAVVIASPRARALERLRAQHPDAVVKIDAAIAAFDAYTRERKGLDDPQDLIRLLRGAGVLHFRIAFQPGEAGPDEARLRQELKERGPKGVKSSDARWYEIEDIETWYESVQDFRLLAAGPVDFFTLRGFVGAERDGVYYMLLHDSPGLRLTEAEGQWGVANAFAEPDRNGLPGIGFEMDAVGARLLGELTGANVGKPMAIVLDDKVYTAPRLNSRIAVRGTIEGGSGGFKQTEVDYIVRTLRAGSLAAKLGESPIHVDVTGPELGADNLRLGVVAGIWSLCLTAGFMVLWYFKAGVVAVAALCCNALFLLALMSLGRAAFTMPGIAGVVLTFGMAVDANVLVYERIREELQAGQTLRNAVRLGFDRALAAIVDGNLTTFIVALVLYWTGTTEIKGFAVTLGIGIATTLFCALTVSRLIFQVGLQWMGWKRMSMLPLAIPALGRALEPRIPWMKYRWGFYIVSAFLVSLGLVTMIVQGSNLLDNEFRGGTAATLKFRQNDPDGPGPQPAAPMTLTRAEVEERLRAFAGAATPGSPQADLINADVIAVNPQRDQVTSDTFTIKTVWDDSQGVGEALKTAFRDVLDQKVELKAASLEAQPILSGALGDSIARPTVRDDVHDLVGGVAVVATGIEPPTSLDELRSRVAAMRAQPDHSEASNRTAQVVVLEGTPEAVTSAAFVTAEPSLSFFDDEPRWRTEIAQPEVALVRDAMQSGSSLAGMQSFSPAIAATFVGKAATSLAFSILGILIYVWVRFGSVRYSVAAVVADIHDAFIAVGLIAVVEFVYERFPGVATALGLQPFKIDLAMVAAILTVLGYSLNDSIVVLDRIRENRGKLAYASADVVNKALNQTFSRTLITGGTTLASCVVLYTLGGQSIRGFAFAIFVGVVVGTYSSLGIAAPIVWSRRVPAGRPSGTGPGQGSGAVGELAKA